MFYNLDEADKVHSTANSFSLKELKRMHKDQLDALRKKYGAMKDCGWVLGVTKSGASLVSVGKKANGDVYDYSTRL